MTNLSWGEEEKFCHYSTWERKAVKLEGGRGGLYTSELTTSGRRKKESCGCFGTLEKGRKNTGGTNKGKWGGGDGGEAEPRKSTQSIEGGIAREKTGENYQMF